MDSTEQHILPEVVWAQIRARISDAYYDARNAGETMEDAADNAADNVVAVLKANGYV